MTIEELKLNIKLSSSEQEIPLDDLLPIPEIKDSGDFRKLLVRRAYESEIDRALIKMVQSAVDPGKVFSAKWRVGPLCKEQFPKATANYINQIPKRVKKCARILCDIFFEAPFSNNPQDVIYLILGNRAWRTLKIVSGLCFEDPDLYSKLSEGWKTAVNKYQGSSYRWEKLKEIKALFGVEVDCRETPFSTYNKFLGTPEEGPEADYFNALYNNPDTHKITGTEMSTRAYDHNLYKDHPESLAFGWFKELRKSAPELEKYLKMASIDYTTEDICDILVYTEIISDSETVSPEEALDLFWENSDTIYEKMFHDNIDETPIRLARTYISMFTVDKICG